MAAAQGRLPGGPRRRAAACVTAIRWAALPPDVAVEVWRQDGDTVIVVNAALPAERQQAALRAALRSCPRRRDGAAKAIASVMAAAAAICTAAAMLEGPDDVAATPPPTAVVAEIPYD